MEYGWWEGSQPHGKFNLFLAHLFLDLLIALSFIISLNILGQPAPSRCRSTWLWRAACGITITKSSTSQGTANILLYYILTNSHSVASYIFLNLATLSTFAAPFSVSIYNENGWIKELPSLDIGRSNHGCGHFINTDNKMVSIKRFFQMFSEDTLYFV